MTFSRAALNVPAVTALIITALAVPALAEDVRIRSTYPLVYGEYTDVSAENEFQAGTPASGALTNIYGDVNVLGDLVITKPENCRVRVAPSMGPQEGDGFRIDTGGNAMVSHPPTANIPRLKVSTILIGGDFFAWGDPADTPSVVGIMRGFRDTSIGDLHKQRKGLFASRPAGSPTLDPAAGTYAPLRMDGREIQFGIEYFNRNNDTNSWGAGLLERVLIGTRAVWTPPTVTPQPELFLQVGNPTETPSPTQYDYAGVDGGTPGLVAPPGGAGSGWRIFSSRDYKKDIVPLTPVQCGAALDAIARLDVVKYHFKGEPTSSALHTGVIAEDLPEMIKSANGQSLNLAEAYAYAAAALKGLKVENDALKARLAVLEARAGKTPR